MAKSKKQIKVKRKNGLHARPATLFVQLANRFNSAIRVENGKESVDGKSIIAILSLGVNKGSKITVAAEGEDSQEALADLEKFLNQEE